MGIVNLITVEPRGNRSLDEYVNYLANLIAISQEDTVNLLEGRLSSVNIREIAGYLVDLVTLKHKSGIVGMSGDDPLNPQAVRFWAGDPDKNIAPFLVRQNGIMEAVGAIIKSATGYPRIELDGANGSFIAYQSANNFVKLTPDAFGSTPGFTFQNGLDVVALIYLLNATTPIFSIATPAGSADISISSGKDMALSATNGRVYGVWSFDQKIQGDISGQASYADRAGSAASADTMAPTGTISWFQVDKGGSNLSHLEIKNLSDLTQSSSYRTVTDTEKNNWNNKVSAPSGGKKMQSGNVLTSATTYDATVTFPTPYAAAPIVTATPWGTSSASQAVIGGITATGFTVRTFDGSGNPAQRNVNWIAIGD